MHRFLPASALLFSMFVYSVVTLASEKTFMLPLESTCSLRVLIQTPPAGVQTRADLLFFTGFADRADNHAPLFEGLSRAGMRVISFDYPSHGESKCGWLGLKTMGDVARYANEIEVATRESNDRPLFVTGWSTGGLIATRMIENGDWKSRRLSGLVILAPGISVFALVGGGRGVRQQTLLSNPHPPHKGPIKPAGPLRVPLFATSLYFSSVMAQHAQLPKGLPTLVIMAGDKADLYAKEVQVKSWYKSQKQSGADVVGLQCTNSKHEMDNEIEPIGNEVRRAFIQFVKTPVNPQLKDGKACQAVR
jgi:pimeloyl-ACP methyl ester carboxylesterase